MPLKDDSGDVREEVPNLNRLENSPDHFGASANENANHESGSGYAECAEYDEACDADSDGSGGKS